MGTGSAPDHNAIFRNDVLHGVETGSVPNYECRLSGPLPSSFHGMGNGSVPDYGVVFREHFLHQYPTSLIFRNHFLHGTGTGSMPDCNLIFRNHFASVGMFNLLHRAPQTTITIGSVQSFLHGSSKESKLSLFQSTGHSDHATLKNDLRELSTIMYIILSCGKIIN